MDTEKPSASIDPAATGMETPGVATISTTVVFADNPHALRRLLEVIAAPDRPARAARRPATSAKA